MASKATEKRFEAMKALSDSIVTVEIHESGPTNVWHTEDATKIAAGIRALAPLGRTDRWKDAVEGWALLVEEKAQDGSGVQGIRWAYFQGGIFAGHAAE
jgi:hypothetical protein